MVGAETDTKASFLEKETGGPGEVGRKNRSYQGEQRRMLQYIFRKPKFTVEGPDYWDPMPAPI